MSYTSEFTCAIADFYFRVSSVDKTLVDQTSTVFARAAVDADYMVIDLDSENTLFGQPAKTDTPSMTIKRVIVTAQLASQKHLFLDSCCLLTPENKRILLVGGSFAGKSTTAVTLALALGWKIVSEDLVFFDTEKNQVVSFVCPLSLRPGSSDMITAIAAKRPDPVYYGRWFVNYEIFAHKPIEPKFDLAVHLELQRQGSGVDDIKCEKVSSDTFSKSLISRGNWLTREGGPEFIWDCFSQSDCWFVNNGTLEQRFVWLRTVAGS